MAFGRKFLSSLGIEEDKVDTIITAHAEVVDALKDEITKYKEDAEKLPEVQKKLDEALKDDGYKEKYETLKSDFDNYKAEVAEKEETAKKTSTYKKMLKDIGIADKRIDTVLRVDADIIKEIELDDKGNIKNAEELKSKAKETWADFIVKQETHGTNPANPPQNTGGTMSKEDIMKIKDTSERQKAIAENHTLFGI